MISTPTDYNVLILIRVYSRSRRPAPAGWLSVAGRVAGRAVGRVRRPDRKLRARRRVGPQTNASLRWRRRRGRVAACIAGRLVRHAAGRAAGHDSACRVGDGEVAQVLVRSRLGAVRTRPSRLADALRRAGTRVPMRPPGRVERARARFVRWLPAGPVHAGKDSLVDGACRRPAVLSQAVLHRRVEM